MGSQTKPSNILLRLGHFENHTKTPVEGEGLHLRL